MAREWNWLGCGTLVVSLRNTPSGSTYSVIDGQQRLTAIKQLGFKEAPCRIYIDLSKEQEAELFELLNHNKKPGFNDLFKSRLMRDEKIAKAIELACTQIGYHLDPERKHAGESSKDKHFYIQTMPELERIYKRGGVVLIMDTLRLLKDIWEPEFIQQQQMALSGISVFVQRYLQDVNRRELISKMKKEGQMKVVQKAYQWLSVHGGGGGGGSYGSRGQAYAEVMLTIYNHNRQESNRIRSKINI